MSILRQLERVPFKRLKWLIRFARYKVATVDYVEGMDELAYDGDLFALTEHFRMQGFESVEKYSVRYDGELLNMRRPRLHHGQPGESHFRVREKDGELLICGHDEYSRFERMTDHVAEKNLEWLSEGEMRERLNL